MPNPFPPLEPMDKTRRSHLKIIVDSDTVKKTSKPLAELMGSVDGGIMLLEEDHVGSMFVLLAIVHERPLDILPAKISISELQSLVHHADKYGLVHRLGTHLKGWMPKQEEWTDPQIWNDTAHTAWIASTIGAKDIYEQVIARLAIKYTNVPSKDDLINRWSDSVRLYETVQVDVEKFRQKGMVVVRQKLKGFHDNASENKNCQKEQATAEERKKCNFKIASSFKHTIKAAGPEFESFFEYTGDGDGTLIEKMDKCTLEILKTKCPTIEGHESCDPFVKTFRVDVRNQEGLSLELTDEQKKDFTRRALISGWGAPKTTLN
ncbi:uncharacterized protein CCOS01_04219 [Colletotrichum costaricense]|uniref:Uncharacterized protein n=1 Tax=Colletotrichum costaricense TaxID=1209916 RepID=A0AAJ0E490_9PEZI|nr:uncharacterized protein CCOS01_04219 [Colletotrichum costaricense]KAK1532236.1 hypothetical protein CCOS01_04219 [Colletotrichum costaricense]